LASHAEADALPEISEKRKIIFLPCVIAENIEEGAGGGFSLEFFY
jgi:hypothetical protein